MTEPILKRYDNGLTAAFLPCEGESVAAGLFVKSGSRHESGKCAGISHFIEHMLFKGTPTRKPIDITRAIEGRGGNFNACTSEVATIFYAHLPKEYLGEAMDILADMYLHATIPEDEFVREKQVVLEEIKMYADEPDSVAMENLQRALFPDSPLGAPVAGSENTLLPLKSADLRSYIQSHYVPADTFAVVVGDFQFAEAEKALSPLLACRRKRAKTKVIATPKRVPPLKDVVVEREVKQTQLAIGYRTEGPLEAKRYALSVIDSILGRGMSSRLFNEVREKRGLSYDISTRMQYFDDAGMFTITAGVDPSKAEKTLSVIEKEIERLKTRRVGAAELKRTKEFMLGNFRLGMEKMLSRLFFCGQGLISDRRIIPIAEQVAEVKAVTADEILEVAREVFAKNRRVISRVIPKKRA